MENQTPVVQESNTVAVISYITLIGWIIALLMHNGDKPSKIGAFHLKQSLGLHALLAAVSIFQYIPFMGFIALIAFIPIFILWIIGIIAQTVVNKLLPVVGGYFNEWFSGVVKS